MKDIFDKVERFVLPIIVIIVLFMVISIYGKNPETASYQASIHANISRDLNKPFRISSQYQARVIYTIKIGYISTPVSGYQAVIVLRYSEDGGNTWETAGAISEKVNPGIETIGYKELQVTGDIPADALVKISSSANNTMNSYITGTETY